MVRVNAGIANPDGGQGLGAGAYHVVVKASGMDPKQPAKVKITFECLAGKTAAGDEIGCVGLTHNEWFEPVDDPKKMSKIFTFAWAAGLITRDQWDQLHKAATSLDLPIENTTGKQLCIQISRSEGKVNTPNAGKIFHNVNWDFWPVWDEKASHVKKDMNWAQSVPGAPAPSGQAPAAPPAAAPPGVANPPAAPTQDYGGF